jgi:hypothetical protein
LFGAAFAIALWMSKPGAAAEVAVELNIFPALSSRLII